MGGRNSPNRSAPPICVLGVSRFTRAHLTATSAIQLDRGADVTECHASKCSRPATTRLRFMNNYSYKDRPTAGLDYCDEHAERVSNLISKGLRVLVTSLNVGTPAENDVPFGPDSPPP